MRHLTSAAGTSVRAAALTALTLFAVAACGGGSDGQNSSTTSASSPAATTTSSAAATSTGSSGGGSQAESTIKQNWTTFFAGDTPADQRTKLLQNGQQFAPYVQQMTQSQIAQQVSAKVSDVSVHGDTATVTYTVLLGGQPALPNQTGTAVLQDGTWKVGDGSFCALLALQGSTPSVCAAIASASASSGSASSGSASSGSASSGSASSSRSAPTGATASTTR